MKGENDMIALTTLFPVFFMVVLGMIARLKGFVTQNKRQEQIALYLMFCFQY